MVLASDTVTTALDRTMTAHSADPRGAIRSHHTRKQGNESPG
jgi:hypothetical protein